MNINMKSNKSEKLFSPQLEKELAEFEGRGSRSPRAYVSSKSYLPKVLLTSNPQIERDLQRQLTHIANHRMKRQKVWEWNQRQFLVSQIFDPDYNLRFTKESLKYSNNFINESISGGNVSGLDDRKNLRNSKHFHQHEDEDGVKISSQYKPDRRSSKGNTGLGVFMPPLHPSQRLIEKARIPSQALNTKNSNTAKFQKKRSQSIPNGDLEIMNMHSYGDKGNPMGLKNGFSSPNLKSDYKDTLMVNLSKGKYDNDIDEFKFQKNDEDTCLKMDTELAFDEEFDQFYRRQLSNIESPSASCRSGILRRQITTSGVLAQDKPPQTVPISKARCYEPVPGSPSSLNQRKVSKSVSLPEIPIYKPVLLDLNGVNTVRTENGIDGLQINDLNIVETHEGDNREILCDEEVINGVTRSLPLSVMIRANQNINKEVKKRKDRMIQKCVKQRDRDSFSDPRWLELNKVLVDNSCEETTDKIL